MERFQQLTETCTLGDAAELNIPRLFAFIYKYFMVVLFFNAFVSFYSAACNIGYAELSKK